MSFREWVKAKKKKREAKRGTERALNLNNNDSGFVVDPSDIDPPETRFTEEYKQFIESQEAALRSAENAADTIENVERAVETEAVDAAERIEETVEEAYSEDDN